MMPKDARLYCISNLNPFADNILLDVLSNITKFSLSQSDYLNSFVYYFEVFCRCLCIWNLTMKENKYLASAITKLGR